MGNWIFIVFVVVFVGVVAYIYGTRKASKPTVSSKGSILDHDNNDPKVKEHR